MRSGTWLAAGAAALAVAGCTPPLRPLQSLSDPEIQRVMRREQVPGLALATVENGQVGRVRVFGMRNAALGQPLTPDTIMVGAALTKTAFAYMLLQLAAFVLCLETGQRCVVMLSNDIRAEGLFPELGRQALGPDDMPWRWAYPWLDDS